MMLRRMAVVLGFVLAFAFLVQAPVPAQTIKDAGDDTTLKQIIIFGRHGVRAPTMDFSKLPFSVSVDPYPPFPVPTGYLTPHGYQAELLLGAYFRDYLLQEGLLTGKPRTDAANSYFRANSIQRSNMTATALWAALFPGKVPQVHSFDLGVPDAVFDPIAAEVVTVDTDRAVREVRGIFNNGHAVKTAYSGEYSVIRGALFDAPIGTRTPPDTVKPLLDPTTLPITLTANKQNVRTGSVIDIGGLSLTNDAADPFVMQYTAGLPLDQVAWGRLTLDQISQQTRTVNLVFSIELLTPYLNRLQSSNAASHVLRTMEQAVSGRYIGGSFGNANSKAVVVISSDGYVAGLAGLLKVHWQLRGYQPDFCAPGGALVFELRQSNKTGEYLVRIFYTAQTFKQLRNLTPLTLDNPPATMQLMVPGGSDSGTSLDVEFSAFRQLMQQAIGSEYVQDPSQEVLPPVLHGVPRK
ncbi:MAG: histidine-type phosphatase [Syntrophobacteraceae bacterium]